LILRIASSGQTHIPCMRDYAKKLLSVAYGLAACSTSG
jgi:hypothetical protein